MTHRIAAIYEQGVLRPLLPLRLHDRQRVEVEIVSEKSGETVEQILEQLTATGHISPPCSQQNTAPLSITERAELARALGATTSLSLSQIILDERGEQ